MNDKKYEISETQELLAIKHFLDATQKILSVFSDHHLLQMQANLNYLVDRNPITLQSIGEAFVKTAQANKSREER